MDALRAPRTDLNQTAPESSYWAPESSRSLPPRQIGSYRCVVFLAVPVHRARRFRRTDCGGRDAAKCSCRELWIWMGVRLGIPEGPPVLRVGHGTGSRPCGRCRGQLGLQPRISKSRRGLCRRPGAFTRLLELRRGRLGVRSRVSESRPVLRGRHGAGTRPSRLFRRSLGMRPRVPKTGHVVRGCRDPSERIPCVFGTRLGM